MRLTREEVEVRTQLYRAKYQEYKKQGFPHNQASDKAMEDLAQYDQDQLLYGELQSKKDEGDE